MPGRVIPVLLCGGSGTRLWPLSTDSRPKQLLPLTGPDTMLQLTAARVPAGDLFGEPLVVAAAALADSVEEQLATPATLILEPSARNTAPAAALAALAAAPGDLLLVMPSDHLVADVSAFHAAVAEGIELARRDMLVVFGVPPTRAETGYGYIKRGAALGDRAFAVERFVEKPDRETAEAWLGQGGYDWNAGIFLFRAGAFLDALAAHAPEVLAAARGSLAAASKAGRRLLPDAAAFARSPSISIDYAVMEKADRIAVVPVEMGWSDIGSWAALYDVSATDEDGNALSAGAMAIDSKGCLLRSTGPRVVAIGVEDLVVIATGDSVLVVPRDRSQRVREAVERIAAEPKADE
jgi:mannose-1-phosphate guanylyltransferase/mannose-1-phosphate guanylyltransferase/mannose-6-phosphate isomerase